MRNKKLGKFGSIFEIIILILGIIAFSYVISPKEKTIAEAQGSVCCERTKEGAWCQNMPSTECNPNYLSSPTSCDSTSFCRMGCCYDSQEGLCMENTPQRICEESKGVWQDSATCDIPQCQLGCCILGTQAAYVTLTRCKQLSSFYNLNTDFRKGIASELECVALASSSDQGACVFEVDYTKTCKFTTRQECDTIKQGMSQMNGTVTSKVDFYKGYLCSAEELATNCGPTERTTCVPGKDEVYFVDSCGNPANIYDASKINDKNYWARVVSKEESCGYGSTNGNANSKTCGNCDYFYGSMCKKADRTNRPDYGEYYCKSLNCKDRKNGESWCSLGDGKGVGNIQQRDKEAEKTGERYFRHICINSEEIIEPCADFKQEICLESDTGGFKQAGCVINRWQDCVFQTYKDDCLNTDRRDCQWLSSVESITPNSSVACVPKYPPGLEFWNDETTKQVCSYGNAVCVYKQKKSTSTGFGWETESNECIDKNEKLKSDWIEKMKEKCASFGDCALQNYGGKKNFVGKSGYVKETEIKSRTIDILLPLIIKVTKPLIIIGSLAVGENGVVVGENGETPQAPTTGQRGGWAGYRAANPRLATFFEGVSWGLTAYGIAKMIGGFVAPEEEEIVERISEAIGVGVMVYRWLLGTRYILGGQGWGLSSGVAAGGAIVIAIVYFLMTYEEERTKQISLECLPYEPPVGGGDCEKCNSDSYPCTEYRCKSLGQACEIINKGTAEEKCVWKNPGDIKSPVIKPWEAVLNPGLVYTGEGIRPPDIGVRIERVLEGGQKGCLKAFTPLVFGISTDEPTQCKIDFNHTTSFENMTFYLGNSNTFKYNHSQYVSLPGPANINAQGPTIKNDGEYTWYIRCRDVNGNANIEEYAIRFCIEKGPDITPPVIVGTSLLNGMPVKYKANSTYLEIYLNEPAECKWSRLDQSYDGMEHEMTCVKGVEEMNAQMLYTCSTTLTAIKDKEENVYYFRCKDQPIGVENKDRNVNQDSYKFVIKGTEPLNIISVSPNNETTKGSTTLVPVFIEVETANGYNFGDSVCFYSLTGNEKDYARMFETGTNKHRQRQDLPAGSYKYWIKCTDLGGNTDYKTLTFNVLVDQKAPEVVRAYNYEDKLRIVTDEISECSYSLNDEIGCNFKISEGISMPYSNSTEHYADWSMGKTYYIKCIDSSGNEPSPIECSAKIRTTVSTETKIE